MYNDPAKLRELAAKINEAAQALEDSKRLTFGDLEVGEYFRQVNYPRGVWLKRSTDSAQLVQSDVHDSYPTQPEPADLPVIRIKATFEVVPNE
jgi:hypothetical protein